MTKIVLQNRWYIIIGLIITGVQLFFDTLNATSMAEDTKMIVGAICMFLSLLSSGYRQFLDPKTSNNTIWVQIALLVAYVGGGILEVFDIMPLPEELAAVVRLGLTFTTNYIPIAISTINNLENK